MTNRDNLFENKKVSILHICASHLFLQTSRTNRKLVSFFDKLKDRIDLDIVQQKVMEQDIMGMATDLRLSVAALILQIREYLMDALKTD